ncbi:MAG: 50S ribosomal protein L15 [uncultured bacterium]|nr:MAG: 50S ribosomal protein L15 [uncultured bacterium]
MKLNELKNNFSKDSGKRLGRGHGSGKGKTSGRGHKGQKSRTGFNIPKRFEGGQTSLIQRLPKARGIKSFISKPVIISYQVLQQKFASGTIISPKVLLLSGLVDSIKPRVKILGPYIGDKTFVIKNCLTSKSYPKKTN